MQRIESVANSVDVGVFKMLDERSDNVHEYSLPI